MFLSTKRKHCFKEQDTVLVGSGVCLFPHGSGLCEPRVGKFLFISERSCYFELRENNNNILPLAVLPAILHCTIHWWCGHTLCDVGGELDFTVHEYAILGRLWFAVVSECNTWCLRLDQIRYNSKTPKKCLVDNITTFYKFSGLFSHIYCNMYCKVCRKSQTCLIRILTKT